MSNYIAYFLSSLSILGSIFNIYKSPWGFVIWSIANVGWIALIGYKEDKPLYGQIPLWIVFTGINIWGWILWRNGGC
jgi:hypothetical protein